MGKPQPKLTAAIIILLLAVAGSVIWFAAQSSREIKTESPMLSTEDMVRLHSLRDDQIEKLFNKDLSDVLEYLAYLGFVLDPEAEPVTLERRQSLPASGNVLEEIVWLHNDPDADFVLGVTYTRLTDAPVDQEYIKRELP